MSPLNPRERIFYLLNKIKEKNKADPDHGEQTLYPSTARTQSIQTLDDNITRPLSTMLKARFEYVSLWVNAHLDQNWLGPDEIKNSKNDPVLMQWLNLRLENWEHLPPATTDKSCVAIFGYNPYEPEETYLVWANNEKEEPEVWRYFGADYKFFKNIESFFAYVAGEKKQDDSGRA